jgi:hypothetical protein
MDTSTGAVDTPSDARQPRRAVFSCHWGQPTLFLSFPDWLSAWDTPWFCSHPAHTGPLETGETCTTCPHWTPRQGTSPDRGRAAAGS